MMTKKKSLRWKLRELPKVSEINDLVEKEIITKEEAKDLLFNSGEVDTDELRDVKGELKLLRELVLELASKQPASYPIFIDRIKYIERWPRPWIQPYATWCSNTAGSATFTSLNSVDASSGDTVIAKY